MVTTIFLSNQAIAEERLTISPGLTSSNRLEVRDATGKIQFYTERTITGNLIVRDRNGSIVGRIKETGEAQEKAPVPKTKWLSLPKGWK